MTASGLKNNRGITLVELIIVVALIGVFIVPLTTMFITNYVAYYRDSAKVSAVSDMRFAFSDVLDYFRRAEQGTIIPDGTQTVNFQLIQGGVLTNGSIWYDSGANELVATVGSTQKTILTNVTAVEIGIAEEGRISIKVTTTTRLPYNDTYIYTQTFDYMLRI